MRPPLLRGFDMGASPPSIIRLWLAWMPKCVNTTQDVAPPLFSDPGRLCIDPGVGGMPTLSSPANHHNDLSDIYPVRPFPSHSAQRDRPSLSTALFFPSSLWIESIRL